jgi:hypothetical protein
MKLIIGNTYLAPAIATSRRFRNKPPLPVLLGCSGAPSSLRALDEKRGTMFRKSLLSKATVRSLAPFLRSRDELRSLRGLG